MTTQKIQIADSAYRTILGALDELDISTRSGNLQLLVVYNIVQIGKPFDEITLGELRQMIKNATAHLEAEADEIRRLCEGY